VIDLVRKTVESVNKSTLLKQKFQETAKAATVKYLKLKNSPAHRWSSIAEVLNRILINWDSLRFSFQKLNIKWPLEGKNFYRPELRSRTCLILKLFSGKQDLLMEFHGVVLAAKSCQLDSQKTKSPSASYDYYTGFSYFYLNISRGKDGVLEFPTRHFYLPKTANNTLGRNPDRIPKTKRRRKLIAV